MKIFFSFALTALALLMGGCGDSLKSARRVRLPQGSAEKGKAAFIALNCTACHTVVGADLPKPTAPPESVLELGGEVARLRTVGGLLTSIIHPTYAISERMKRPAATAPVKSPMPVVNDVMTVTQLIDLVTFLQPHYKQLPPPSDSYYAL